MGAPDSGEITISDGGLYHKSPRRKSKILQKLPQKISPRKKQNPVLFGCIHFPKPVHAGNTEQKLDKIQDIFYPYYMPSGSCREPGMQIQGKDKIHYFKMTYWEVIRWNEQR